MPHPNVTAIFPAFEDPDHFERTLTGRYVCKLCPESDGTRRTFNTEKAALAHERSTDHVYYADLEKNNPWDAAPGADSAGWGSVAANEQANQMTLEEAKDQEYRKRVSELPGAIEKWRAGFLAFARDGAMLPADEPPPPSKRKLRRGRATKNANMPPGDKITQTSESAPCGAQRPINSIATSSIEGRDAVSTQLTPRSHIRHISTSTASSKPIVETPPVRTRRKLRYHFFVEVDISCCFSLLAAHPKKVSASPPIELTPELRQWMAKMVIEMRFSPTRARQMREFIQVPLFFFKFKTPLSHDVRPV